ncbi:MAG: Na/Pi symporter [Planctomycetaceae bacterium]|jgi:phosphate:Na+ symporter|nr:Na/Pi symporter [Planctomycetaceae bacterium]
MKFLDALPIFLAGLAFFFMGLDSIKSSLQGLASRSMRRRAARATASPLRAGLLGLGFGAVTQSATAVSFVVASLVATRVLALRRGLSIVAWANPGTAALAFLAAIDLRIATMWIVGLVALVLRNRASAGIRPALTALFGVGCMLFGLSQLKDAATPAQDAAWFATISGFLSSSFVLAFAIGVVLRTVIQSSSGIAVILITLCGAGLLTPDYALMTIHGTSIGIALSIMLLGRGAHGEALRIGYYQALVNIVAGLVMAAFMLGANLLSLPDTFDLLGALGLGLKSTLALGFLVQMLVCPLAGALLGRHALPLLERLAPESEAVSLAKPRYLSESAAESAEAALGLVSAEQHRMLAAMPGLLAPLTAQGPAELQAALRQSETLGESLTSLHGEVTGFLVEVLEHANEPATAHAYLHAGDRQQALGEIAADLARLVREIAALPEGSTARMLGGLIGESTEETLREAIASSAVAHAERAKLESMLDDRHSQMEPIRRIAAQPDFGNAREQASIQYATTLFERLAYLLRRATRPLDELEDDGSPTEPRDATPIEHSESDAAR